MSAEPTPATSQPATEDPIEAWRRDASEALKLPTLDLRTVNAMGEIIMAARCDERARFYLPVGQACQRIEAAVPALIAAIRASVGDEKWGALAPQIEPVINEAMEGMWTLVKSLRDGAHVNETWAPNRTIYPVRWGARARTFGLSPLELAVATAPSLEAACDAANAGDPWKYVGNPAAEGDARG